MVLTVIVPGLGHAYLRLWGRALLWFLLVVGTLVALVPGWSSASSVDDLVAIAEGLDPVVSLVLLGVSVLCLLDAYLMTSRHNDRARGDRTGAMASCPECGRELDGDIDFCHWCTARLGGREE